MPITATEATITSNGSYNAASTPIINTTNGKTNAFLVSGTFDGATIKLQHKVKDAYVDVGSDTTVTAAGGGLFTSPVADIQVVASGGGGSLDVDVVIKPIYP